MRRAEEARCRLLFAQTQERAEHKLCWHTDAGTRLLLSSYICLLTSSCIKSALSEFPAPRPPQPPPSSPPVSVHKQTRCKIRRFLYPHLSAAHVRLLATRAELHRDMGSPNARATAERETECMYVSHTSMQEGERRAHTPRLNVTSQREQISSRGELSMEEKRKRVTYASGSTQLLSEFAGRFTPLNEKWGGGYCK